MDIRCRKTTCHYNNNYTCCAKEININNNILCKTFKVSNSLTNNDKNNSDLLKIINNAFNNEKTPKKQDSSKKMFKKPVKIAPVRSRKKISITCKSGCLFNCDGICKANGITINDIHDKPICMGYLPR